MEAEASVVWPLLCALATCWCCGWCLRAYWFGEASRGWPRVQGTIVELRHDESLDEDAPGGVSFSSHMTYTYAVSGKTYRSKHFTYRPTGGLRQQDAYAMLRGLRRGQSVDVHYDPAEPSRAVVISGTDAGNTQLLVFWGVMLVASLAWLLVRVV